MKRCIGCNEDKTLSEFSNNARKKDGKQTYCKACKKIFDANYFKNNKEKFYEHNKAKRKANRKRLAEYKATLKCSKCPESRHWCLDFHHTNDDKTNHVADMMGANSWETIMKEIDKCIVVCRNCHADIHYQEKIMALSSTG